MCVMGPGLLCARKSSPRREQGLEAHPIQAPGALASEHAAAEADHEQAAQHDAQDRRPPAVQTRMAPPEQTRTSQRIDASG